jgi:hypothetical protein
MGAHFRALNFLHLVVMARDRADGREDPTRIRGGRRYTDVGEIVPSILTQHGTQFRDEVCSQGMFADRWAIADFYVTVRVDIRLVDSCMARG